MTDVPAPTDATVPEPVPALAYAEPHEPWPLEVKVIIGVAVASALMGLLALVTSLWMVWKPRAFQTVGTTLSRSSHWYEWLPTGVHAIASALVVVGGLQFLGRRGRAREMLSIGAGLEIAVVLFNSAQTFIRYRLGNAQATPADLCVDLSFDLNWLFHSLLIPLLLLALITRPHVRARFAR